MSLNQPPNATLNEAVAHGSIRSSADSLDRDYPTAPDNRKKDVIKELPWWKRPSPLWLLAATPFMTIAFSATIAPRIEIYTYLGCREHRPEMIDLGSLLGMPHNLTTSHISVDHTPSFTPFSRSQNEYELGYSNPDEQLPCASDPVVQAAATKLITVITGLMGVLTCLTAGYWGSFSDRYGRTRIMAISLLGSLAADIVYISVFYLYSIIPGGSWFLLAAPIVEGITGGMAAGEASLQSYMSDITDEGNRSRFFSLTAGLMLVGVAVGPTLGSIIISYTHQTLSVFYLAAAIHFLLALWALFVLPESSSEEQRQKSKEKYLQEVHNSFVQRESDTAGTFTKFQHMVPFLRPLAVFIPRHEKVSNPLKRPKRDWSLTLLALGYGSTVAIMACYPFKLQYAGATFHWDSVDMGYYMGLVGITSGVFLVVIFPVVLKLFRPNPMIIEIQDTTNPAATTQKEVHSPSFDLKVVKASLILNVAVYCFLGLTRSALAFTIASMIGSFGLGFSPATQSVAITLYTGQGEIEVGRLFGALGVVQALSSQFVGPFFYGVIYAKTVASYPRTIFFVCATSLALALLFMSLIRIPRNTLVTNGTQEDLEETEPLLGNHSTASRS
ncbi:hypothetical protein CVT24_004416 [Panaeolus cyanescens]|uniref:Major facilitator superfamily (MFS) profile domain-containing protein n=1 Tax=Panaeolus cyanescens TaxID=181874 RepID=A0A409VA12_9AGAR|nr:hypothetical protein CVT24_004416 [Panaeolus cyanescens]